MTRTEPLPLLLLTGFLGSGKTTTLGHWLAHTDLPLKRTAVIINDFGSVNVDAALLARRQLELRSITGGCVCCQSFDDLVQQVSLLADSPDYDLVWIETSGLADPEEVLDHLSSPQLHDRTPPAAHDPRRGCVGLPLLVRAGARYRRSRCATPT